LIARRNDLTQKEKIMSRQHCGEHHRGSIRQRALLAALVLGASFTARADVVEDWNRTAQAVFTAKAAPANPNYAIVHTAIYDAVVAIKGGYKPYAIRPSSPTQGASAEAAAASAGYHVLLALFPDQQAVLDAALTASLAAIPDGAAETKGVAVGSEVAAAIVALRANDHRSDVVPYEFGSGPGVYQRTPPAFPNPVNTNAPGTTPFALTRGSQFRAYGPPGLTSTRYSLDLAEVRRMGAAEGSKRTAVQSEIARFHTENPNVFWIRNLRETIATHDMTLVERARLYALMNVVHADTIIACFDSKYYYNFWRPVTAIQNADSDDNPDTTADAAWLPYMVTPPHPEYPAAHGCVAGATAETLQRFFGTKLLAFTFTSTVPDTVPHFYATTDALVKEIVDARVYGGMHYRNSGLAGVDLGRRVARWIYLNRFQPVAK
jgi:hypothetical protein